MGIIQKKDNEPVPSINRPLDRIQPYKSDLTDMLMWHCYPVNIHLENEQISTPLSVHYPATFHKCTISALSNEYSDSIETRWIMRLGNGYA